MATTVAAAIASRPSTAKTKKKRQDSISHQFAQRAGSPQLAALNYPLCSKQVESPTGKAKRVLAFARLK